MRLPKFIIGPKIKDLSQESIDSDSASYTLPKDAGNKTYAQKNPEGALSKYEQAIDELEKLLLLGTERGRNEREGNENGLSGELLGS